MGQNQILTPNQASIDPVTQFGYPATCTMEILTNPMTMGEIHRIDSPVAPTSATVSASNYAKAPAGSSILDRATPKLWFNVAGTWVGTALS